MNEQQVQRVVEAHRKGSTEAIKGMTEDQAVSAYVSVKALDVQTLIGEIDRLKALVPAS